MKAVFAQCSSKWTFWTWFREPLDAVSFLSSLLALCQFKR